MNKTTVKISIFIMLMIFTITGCLSGGSLNMADDDMTDIVCTIFPQYDWTRNIAGENNEKVRINLLINNGVDMHSYQPSAADIAKISSCDVFIYVGGESDKWVEGVIAEAANKDMKIINLMEVLEENIMEEETVEGMQTDDHGHDHDDETEYDEHVWLSLKNAVLICENIAEILSETDSDNAADYRKNAEEYIGRLNALDEKYEKAVSEGMRDTILFGDRFPFRYMTEDYGINYYAAFAGCSAETEASFETIAFLSGKIDDEELPVVFTIDNSNHALAGTIVNNTKNKNQKILSLNSMQSVTSKDIEAGAAYISIMESNLGLIEEALN